MSLSVVVNRAFNDREGAIDKPSFSGHEMMYASADGRHFLVIQPENRRATHVRTPHAVTQIDTRAINPKNFNVLLSVEGYFVGGMGRAECTCGSEPIFVNNAEQSREPGFNHLPLFDAMRISRDIRNYSNVPKSSNGSYHLPTIGSSVDLRGSDAPFLPNRRYEVWNFTDRATARRFEAGFGRVQSVKQGARFDVCDYGSGVLCMLSAPYVVMRPGQEKAVARQLITGVFGS